MIQFYRWTLSFPPLVGPQNPRAVRLVNKLIGNTTHATCLKAVFGKKDDFGCPQQLTGVLRIFPAVFDFSSVCYIPVQLHQKSDADSYFLKLCPHLFSEVMPPLIFRRYAPLILAFCHRSLVSIDASRLLPSCIRRPFDDPGTCRRLQDDRDCK